VRIHAEFRGSILKVFETVVRRPRTQPEGAVVHGRYSAEARAERARAVMRELAELLRMLNA
jgi:hypothetical protein